MTASATTNSTGSEPSPRMRKVADVKAGQRVKATGKDTRGYTVTRAGRLLAAPKRVMAQDWDKRIKKWRLHISDEPGAMPAHRNSLSLPMGAEVELLPEA
ncbi:hypothetical protein BLA24_25750 [Streptomyces cinnamoneus]|uniref:Uncharacterized protein n=1 Tax=Streptomyces cinnamoneus TaxID=53446 RepID=A0A2G1XDZ7_STRCJ|nr:hypothetical protein [Streptomyces cinnamoneus]PHQ49448.1 hypothetical protein BLA24_25750 [Streptomyces cinnamoneus]PPT14902.1 hypothetical protein CYQ11_20320 [Streptomyces cinnamoneus]